MKLLEQVSLKPYNTLALDVPARYLTVAEEVSCLREAIAFAREHQLPWIVLGQGSNLVLQGPVPGLVIINRLLGVTCDISPPEQALYRVRAGENWHALVARTLADGFHGLENLALIPGTLGAAPVQNIGAYGVELSDRLESVTALNTLSGELESLSAAQCRFGYRDSLFKQPEGQHLIITEVALRLDKRLPLNLDYGELKQRLAVHPHPNAEDVFAAVCAIRQGKLPLPEQVPNAGSFFKNPVVSADQAAELAVRHPGMVSYRLADGSVKLAAGWLIEACGWRGRRLGQVAMHDRQALVMVNLGGATPSEVMALARRIQGEVFGVFGVGLEMEPVCYGGIVGLSGG